MTFTQIISLYNFDISQTFYLLLTSNLLGLKTIFWELDTFSISISDKATQTKLDFSNKRCISSKQNYSTIKILKIINIHNPSSFWIYALLLAKQIRCRGLFIHSRQFPRFPVSSNAQLLHSKRIWYGSCHVPLLPVRWPELECVKHSVSSIFSYISSSMSF